MRARLRVWVRVRVMARARLRVWARVWVRARARLSEGVAMRLHVAGAHARVALVREEGHVKDLVRGRGRVRGRSRE